MDKIITDFFSLVDCSSKGGGCDWVDCGDLVDCGCGDGYGSGDIGGRGWGDGRDWQTKN